MHQVALVALVDERGWLLMQERDAQAPVDPDKWGLVGGSVEGSESHADAARRELAEETGVGAEQELAAFASYVLPCPVAGALDHIVVFTARTALADSDIDCHEGRQIVFVAPGEIEQLDLTVAAREIAPAVLALHAG